MSRQVYQLYETVLAKHAPEDVHHVLQQMISEPRAAYAPAFPELGAIVQRVELARQQRITPPKFVPCGLCYDGRIYVDASGQPCDVSLSPDRRMANCTCRRQWLDDRRRRALTAEAA